MAVLSSVLGAIIVIMGYFASIKLTEKKWEINIRSKAVIVVAIVSFATLVWIGLAKDAYVDIFQLIIKYVLILGMSVLAITDYQKHLVPNKIVLIMLSVWFLIWAINMLVDFQQGIQICGKSLFGAIVSGAIFLLCYLLSRGQLGAGDVKLSFVMGLYATSDRIIGIIAYGMVVCCVYSIIQLIRKKIGLKDAVPLVPFLYLGTLITLVIL